MKTSLTTILVVEDDENDRFLIKTAFQEAGVSGPVQFANDGAEAIAYMLGEGKYSDREKYAYPSFILMDLKMPNVDGFGVMEFLKKNPLWKIIPTTVLSASDDPDDIKKAYMLGASSYHVKPHEMDELRKLLKLLYQYWQRCEMPQVDFRGKQLPTESRGKLGERFPQESTSETKPHR